MEFTGTILEVSPLKTSTSGRQFRSYLMEIVPGEYPERIEFNAWGEKVDSLNLIQGYKYKVNLKFAINEFKGKRYNNISVQSAVLAENGQQPSTPQQPQAQPQPQSFGAPNGNPLNGFNIPGLYGDSDDGSRPF